MSRRFADNAALLAALILARNSAEGVARALDVAIEMVRMSPVQLSGQSTGQALDKRVDKGTGQPPGQAGGQLASLASSSGKLSESLSVFESSQEEEEKEAAAAASAREGGQGAGQAGGQGGLDRWTGQTGLTRSLRLAGLWDGQDGMATGGSVRARIGEIVPLLERLAAERKTDPETLFAAAVKRFKADATVRAKRFGIRVLLSQLEQWVDDSPPLPPNGSSAAVALNHPSRRLLNQPPEPKP